jgi:hypothetical protein
MLLSYRQLIVAVAAVSFSLAGSFVTAQSGGSSGSINGTVADPTGAVVPNAIVEIQDPVSHFDRSATTDQTGNFSIPNVPFNPYHMTVKAEGFAPTAQDVVVRSVVPVSVNVSLQVLGSTTSVTVTDAGDNVELDSTSHSDIDRSSIEKEGPTTGLNSVVQNSTPGIAADSNGQLHGLGGEHDCGRRAIG